MSAPVFSYSGMQISYPVNVPMSVSPVNIGDAPSPRLRIATVSGNSNNMDFPKDGRPNVATYRFPNSVSARPDGTLVVIDDSNTVRVISPSGLSTTLAGKYEVINGVLQTGYADGVGSAAKFNTPLAAAFDPSGNIIVLDTYNFRIRKVTLAGVVTTLAGSGVSGISDGTGLSAQFKMLTSLWIDNSGNIFVTDGYRVRKITPAGVVTTIAGNIVKGNTNGTGTGASFKTMRGITGDNLGNLFVSDTENGSIRKIDALTVVSTVIAGINPTGIAFDSGLLKVSDYILNQIITVMPLSGTYMVFAGSGVGQFKDGFDTRTGRTAAALYAPEGVAVIVSGPNTITYVADRNSMKIRKVDTANYTISAPLPEGLDFDSTTGVISGIPTKVTPLTTYQVVAANASGYTTVTIGFKIT